MRRPKFLLPCLTALLAEPPLAGGDVRVTEGIAYERLLAFAGTALR